MTKQTRRIVVIGDIEAGKSTLLGHLLMMAGHVNKTLIEFQEDTFASKPSTFYAKVITHEGR